MQGAIQLAVRIANGPYLLPRSFFPVYSDDHLRAVSVVLEAKRIIAALQALATAPRIRDRDADFLADTLLLDAETAAAFGISVQNAKTIAQERLALLQTVHSEFCRLQVEQALPPETIASLWFLWLPLGQRIAARARTQVSPFVQGILGSQGMGKSTLVRVLQVVLGALGVPSACLSLDDLYLTYAERQALQQIDPRSIWRGPPGTHDIALGIATLDRLRVEADNPAARILLPRFDKSLHGGAGDRAAPESISPVRALLFEGWFVGARPIDPLAFATAPPPIVTDSDRAFARDCNARLHEYLPLWERLDSLIVLQPEDYRWSKLWRQEAERKAIAAGKAGMDDRQVSDFVDYFWKALHPTLFVDPLCRDPRYTELVIPIPRNRCTFRVQFPASLSPRSRDLLP